MGALHVLLVMLGLQFMYDSVILTIAALVTMLGEPITALVSVLVGCLLDLILISGAVMLLILATYFMCLQLAFSFDVVPRWLKFNKVARNNLTFVGQGTFCRSPPASFDLMFTVGYRRVQFGRHCAVGARLLLRLVVRCPGLFLFMVWHMFVLVDDQITRAVLYCFVREYEPVLHGYYRLHRNVLLISAHIDDQLTRAFIRYFIPKYETVPESQGYYRFYQCVFPIIKTILINCDCYVTTSVLFSDVFAWCFPEVDIPRNHHYRMRGCFLPICILAARTLCSSFWLTYGFLTHLTVLTAQQHLCGYAVLLYDRFVFRVLTLTCGPVWMTQFDFLHEQCRAGIGVGIRHAAEHDRVRVSLAQQHLRDCALLVYDKVVCCVLALTGGQLWLQLFDFLIEQCCAGTVAVEQERVRVSSCVSAAVDVDDVEDDELGLSPFPPPPPLPSPPPPPSDSDYEDDFDGVSSVPTPLLPSSVLPQLVSPPPFVDDDLNPQLGSVDLDDGSGSVPVPPVPSSVPGSNVPVSENGLPGLDGQPGLSDVAGSSAFDAAVQVMLFDCFWNRVITIHHP